MDIDPNVVARELGAATCILSHHGLTNAASWSAELYRGLDYEKEPMVDVSFAEGWQEGRRKCDLSHGYEMAMGYFRLKEYVRSADSFEKCSSVEGTFMKYYARLLAVERRSPSHIVDAKRQVSEGIRKEMERTVIAPGVADAFLCYLYGSLGHDEQSKAALIQSVSQFPCNWEAWKALSKYLRNEHEMDEMLEDMPNHWMNHFFRMEVFFRLKSHPKAMSLLSRLQRHFPSAPHVQAEMSKCLYKSKHYDESLQAFEELMRIDPERVKDVDVYASLLYVRNMKVDLALLARKFLERHKFTPEACIIVGHNYSIKREHKRAIDYFRRAVELDDDCLSARMFMAQEYIEQRDYASALQALQQVIDRDCSCAYAWHLRGRAYELGEAMTLAEEAFSRATCLDPEDGDMWLSRGICNLRLQRYKVAEVCLKRAKEEGCIDGTADTYYHEVRRKLHPGKDNTDEEDTRYENMI